MAKLKTKPGSKKSGRKIETGKALERSPSHLLHRALQLALDIYAEETGPDAVTQRQYAVLAAVAAHEGLTQTDLVRSTGIDRSTLADLVARMIGKTLLARQRSTADARANTVSLTEAGRAALEAAKPRVAAADARILKLLHGPGGGSHGRRRRQRAETEEEEKGQASQGGQAAEAGQDLAARQSRQGRRETGQDRGQAGKASQGA